MKRLFWLICTLVSTLAFTACESPDEMTGDDELMADEAESALNLSVVWKGITAYDSIKASTLISSSTTEAVHKWKFMPTSGQTVTFGLDIPTSAGGAWLCLTTSINPPSSPADCTKNDPENAVVFSLTSTHIDFSYTFPNTTGLFLYVRQATPAVGSFAYKLSTQREKCATMTGTIVDTYWTPSTGTWAMMAAKRFPAGSTESPSTWTPSYPNATFSTSTRAVKLGSCTANLNPSCGTTGPAVCESDYTFLGQSMVDNACVAKNLILERADSVTPNSWIGWWKQMAQCPGE